MNCVGVSNLFPARIEHLVMNDPKPVLLLEIPHANLGIDFGAVVARVGQVVHQDGILCAVIAAGDAVAAERACVLRHAGGVDPVFERDVDGRAVKLFLEGSSRLLKRLEFRERGKVVRIRSRSQHLLRELIPGLQAGRNVGPELVGPARIVKHARLGGKRYIRIHQRRPTQSAAAEDIDVIVDAHVVKAGPGAQKSVGRIHLGLGEHLGQGIGIFSGLEFAAAFEDAHLLAGARQSRRGDGAAITRSDNHHGVMSLEVLYQ